MKNRIRTCRAHLLPHFLVERLHQLTDDVERHVVALISEVEVGEQGATTRRVEAVLLDVQLLRLASVDLLQQLHVVRERRIERASQVDGRHVAAHRFHRPARQPLVT